MPEFYQNLRNSYFSQTDFRRKPIFLLEKFKWREKFYCVAEHNKEREMGELLFTPY